MNLRIYLLIMVALLGAACNRAPKNNEAIRQGVLDHLSRNTGLDVNAMNIEITSVKYRDNEADANVSFKPKNAPGDGMSMSYTLENKGDKWVVKKKAGGDSAHSGGEMPGAGMGGGAMPSGHPPAGGGAQTGSSDLPAGHPPMGKDAPKTK